MVGNVFGRDNSADGRSRSSDEDNSDPLNMSRDGRPQGFLGAKKNKLEINTQE